MMHSCTLRLTHYDSHCALCFGDLWILSAVVALCGRAAGGFSGACTCWGGGSPSTRWPGCCLSCWSHQPKITGCQPEITGCYTSLTSQGVQNKEANPFVYHRKSAAKPPLCKLFVAHHVGK